MLDTPDQAASLSLSPARREPEAWVALVEAYLPQPLRSLPNCDISKPVKDTSQLSFLLSKARWTAPLKMDILGYMGIHQGRWDAVRWIVQNLAGNSQATIGWKGNKSRKGTVPWGIAEPNPFETSSLDEITRLPICFEVMGRKTSGGHKEIKLGFESITPRSDWLGQIWTMLASMVLRAADYPSDDSSSKKIMSFVLEILAHLHHIDAVPRTVYTHDFADYKPPTLSLMACRIMMALSDSAWRAQDEEIRKEAESIGAKNWYKGHEVPAPTIQPRVDRLAKEIWLEVILWCCVEGGHFSEASWVVTEMLKRKGNNTWKVIAWSEIRRPEEPKLNWSARAELQIARSHISHIGPGISIAGPSEVPPLVDMGPRTVSREVILALINGLATSLRPVVEIQRHIVACRNLLNKKRSLDLETDTLNKAVLDIFQSGLVDSEHFPEAAARALELAPTNYDTSQDHGNALKSHMPRQFHDEYNSAACLGLLHRTLYNHVVKGNIQASLRTFHKIQTIIDANRNHHITSFASELKLRSQTNSTDRFITETLNNILPSSQPQIPVHILSAFLQLLISAHHYDLGNWLLYSEEVDGPFIPPSLYSELNLQSALLRLATATQNGQLFARITEKLKAPLAPDILRTLLHCQITLGKWDQAEEILRHFQAEGVGWTDEDVMVVARSILRLEHNEDVSQPQSPAPAQFLLQGLLNGDFNPPPDPSQGPDYSDFRRLTQIYRMLRTLPGSLHYLKEPPFNAVSRANAPIEIKADAFGLVLEGVVEARGSVRGWKMWKLWCRPSEDSVAVEAETEPKNNALDLNVNEREEVLERVVTPTLQTLRVLMRPLVEQGKVPTRSLEAGLVEWAVGICRGFGLTDKEIEYELGGLWSSK